MAARPPVRSAAPAVPAPTASPLSEAVALRTPWLAAALLVVAGLLAFANTFSVPLHLDDTPTLLTNPSIRRLATALAPPDSAPTGGRPLLNLSFALNYTVGGPAVAGYHAVNLAIHLLAGLVLFGVLRRTLLTPALRPRFAPHADWLAAVIALLWLVHPVQTSAVTYLSQRAEALMGLCYLATLYAILRATASPYPKMWYAIAWFACLAGMATKEVMVTAPVVALLFDRTFLAASWREVWSRRALLYVGLAASWLLLAALMLGSHVSDRGVGFGSGYTAWSYALIETRALAHYLGIAFWPAGLVFDFGHDIAPPSGITAVLLASFVATLLALTVAAWRSWPAAAFAGTAFFVLLAPTSSVIPVVAQPIAESRLYLPLAPLVALAVAALYLKLGRPALFVTATLAVAATVATFQRNAVYRTELSLWTDTVAKNPGSSRAHNYYGLALAADPARLAEAIPHYERALEIRPDFPEAHNNLANALAQIPARRAEALSHYEAALRARPGYAEVETNLANLLADLPGRLPDALAHYASAARLLPDSAIIHQNYGHALARSGQFDAAVVHLETALRLSPDYAKAHTTLANVLAATGRESAALPHYEAALRLTPDSAPAHNSLANLLAQNPATLPRAISLYETALRLQPDYLEAHYNLAKALLPLPGRQAEARAHLELILRTRPDLTPARELLDRIPPAP